MLQEYASLAATCSKERVDYPTYLLRLAERELIDRERRAAERRIKAARFPVIKTLDTFDFNAQPSLNQALIRELITGEYIDHHGASLTASAYAGWRCLMSGRPVRNDESGINPVPIHRFVGDTL